MNKLLILAAVENEDGWSTVWKTHGRADGTFYAAR